MMIKVWLLTIAILLSSNTAFAATCECSTLDGNKAGCQAQAGCTWTFVGECGGALSDEYWCSSFPGHEGCCSSVAGTGCSGEFEECPGYIDLESCLTGGCSWDSGSCVQDTDNVSTACNQCEGTYTCAGGRRRMWLVE